MSEFPDKARKRPTTEPALDPPMTVRVEGGQDRAVRFSTTARRAIKTDQTDRHAKWLVVVGDSVGTALDDDQVRDWLVVHWLINETAYAQPAAPREGLVQPAERGDMGVEVFKG